MPDIRPDQIGTACLIPALSLPDIRPNPNLDLFPEYAAAEKAAMILLEHRYYGKSHPTEDIRYMA